MNVKVGGLRLKDYHFYASLILTFNIIVNFTFNQLPGNNCISCIHVYGGQHFFNFAALSFKCCHFMQVRILTFRFIVTLTFYKVACKLLVFMYCWCPYPKLQSQIILCYIKTVKNSDFIGILGVVEGKIEIKHVQTKIWQLNTQKAIN